MAEPNDTPIGREGSEDSIQASVPGPDPAAFHVERVYAYSLDRPRSGQVLCHTCRRWNHETRLWCHSCGHEIKALRGVTCICDRCLREETGTGWLPDSIKPREGYE